MGFERSQIEVALRAAFFNPDRAIEYLLNGLPDTGANPEPPTSATSPPPAAAQPAQPAQTGGDEPINLFEAAAQANQGGRGSGGAGTGAAATRGGAGATAAGAGGITNMDLTYLRNSPHFQQLRQIVQQQPSMLEPILQQVAEGNPQLAQMIGLNPDQFLQLLAEVRCISFSIRSDTKHKFRAKKAMMVHFPRVAPPSVLLPKSAMPSSDYVDLDSPEIKSSRRTLLAIRTKNWQPTSYSSSLKTMTRSKPIVDRKSVV